jgi:integrase
MSKHAEKTQIDERRRCDIICTGFQNFRSVRDVIPPDCVDFLAEYQDMPRTHDLLRAQLLSIFKFSELKGWRPAGSNPVAPIPTLGSKPRDRFITDAEILKIKAAATLGDDGKETRSGPMLCALIDMAVLTGQRIGDLLDLRWAYDELEPNAPHIRADGIWFRPAKVRDKTSVAILVEWTPALTAVVTKLKELKLAKPGGSDWVFILKAGQQYTYSGAQTAWKRAIKRAGVRNVHFHDLRAKAITERESAEGMTQARVLAGHSTEAQTSDYLRGKTARKTKATR